MDKQSLFEEIIDNWHKPLTTVSFWVLVVMIESLSGIVDISNDIFTWLKTVFILIAYIFAIRIDEKIQKIMFNNKNSQDI
ncbi:hypothetical protein KF982_005118 [Escherichia coli]|jgi:hypothetical protein|nr:hypothetical protein [Escherichia coli]